MLNLKDREWYAFLLTDIFVISPGKRLTKADMQFGKRPFIGATEFNNGVTNWVSNENESLDSNVLGVNYNGSVVATFYHPYECIFSDDVKRFRLKEKSASRLAYLFLKTCIIQQKPKFAYGYKFNESRMNKQSILLPTTEDGKPDWFFMEEYVRERENNLIKEYEQWVVSKLISRGGGYPYLSIRLTGRNSSYQKYSPLFNVVNASKQQTTLKAISHIFLQQPQIMGSITSLRTATESVSSRAA